jgi:hypothetical protein
MSIDDESRRLVRGPRGSRVPRRWVLPALAAVALVIGVAGSVSGLRQRATSSHSTSVERSWNGSFTRSITNGSTSRECATVIKSVQNVDGSLTQTISFKEFVSTRVLPPANFDPLTATDAQLVEFGFRRRPNEPALLAAWTKEYSDYTGTSPGLWCSDPTVVEPGVLPVAADR